MVRCTGVKNHCFWAWQRLVLKSSILRGYSCHRRCLIEGAVKRLVADLYTSSELSKGVLCYVAVNAAILLQSDKLLYDLSPDRCRVILCMVAGVKYSATSVAAGAEKGMFEPTANRHS